MKLEADRPRYPMPDAFDVLLGVEVHFAPGFTYTLALVDIADLPMQDIRAFPSHCAASGTDIVVWPAPDREYEATVRYQPKIKLA